MVQQRVVSEPSWPDQLPSCRLNVLVLLLLLQVRWSSSTVHMWSGERSLRTSSPMQSSWGSSWSSSWESSRSVQVRSTWRHGDHSALRCVTSGVCWSTSCSCHSGLPVSFQGRPGTLTLRSKGLPRSPEPLPWLCTRLSFPTQVGTRSTSSQRKFRIRRGSISPLPRFTLLFSQEITSTDFRMETRAWGACIGGRPLTERPLQARRSYQHRWSNPVSSGWEFTLATTLKHPDAFAGRHAHTQVRTPHTHTHTHKDACSLHGFHL